VAIGAAWLSLDFPSIVPDLGRESAGRHAERLRRLGPRSIKITAGVGEISAARDAEPMEHLLGEQRRLLLRHPAGGVVDGVDDEVVGPTFEPDQVADKVDTVVAGRRGIGSSRSRAAGQAR